MSEENKAKNSHERQTMQSGTRNPVSKTAERKVTQATLTDNQTIQYAKSNGAKQRKHKPVSKDQRKHKARGAIQ